MKTIFYTHISFNSDDIVYRLFVAIYYPHELTHLDL